MLRSARGVVLLATFLAGCQAGLPTEPVGLAGTWTNAIRRAEGFVFQDDPDGRWGGFWYGSLNGERIEISMARVRYAYPSVEVDMAPGADGACWPLEMARGCTVRGELIARNRMRLDGEEYVRGTN